MLSEMEWNSVHSKYRVKETLKDESAPLSDVYSIGLYASLNVCDILVFLRIGGYASACLSVSLYPISLSCVSHPSIRMYCLSNMV
jgi:hypothetical protein